MNGNGQVKLENLLQYVKLMTEERARISGLVSNHGASDNHACPFNETEWTLVQVRTCAQQMNGCDCGVYVIKFAELFLEQMTPENTTFDVIYMDEFRVQLALYIISQQNGTVVEL